MKIIEMSPEELICYPVRTALEARPSNNLLIIKTEVKPLGACIFNVFSPHSEIFWYFGIYKKMFDQLRRYEEIYRNDGVNFVNALCKQYKLPKKDRTLYSFFYPIVSGKGDMFFPRSDDPEIDLVWFLAQRHISVIFPLDRAEKMLSYFNEQLSEFGDLCFRELDEKVVVADDGNIDNLYGYNFWFKHPVKMSAEEKRQAISLLQDANFLSAIDKRLMLIIGKAGGLINSNPRKEKTPDPLNVEICKRRFDLCSEVCTPNAYEGIQGLLSNLAPEDEYLMPLFEKRLSKLKEKYPVMDMTI